MYARQVGSQKLTFSVSGMLWNRSLVMMDQETKSLWSHILGQAMEGKLKGKTLDLVPSTMTDWGTWRQLHPHTSVVNLSRTSQEFRREFYRDASRFVLGITQHGSHPTAWSFQKLAEQSVVNDKVGDTPVVVFFDDQSKTALAFDRRLRDKTFTFQRRGTAVIDRETETVWNFMTGKGVDGTLKGESLRPLPAIVSFTTAWVNFHPDTRGLSPTEIEQARTSQGRRGLFQGNSRPRQLSAREKKERQESRKRLRRAVALMKQHDSDADGKLSKEELAGATLPKNADRDDDGIVTFKELVESLRAR